MRPILIAFVTAAATASVPTTVAQEPVRSQIKASLKAVGRTPVFSLFGTELTYGHYRVAASLPRVPCSGIYRFTAVKASLSDGTTGEFTGDLRLGRPKVKGIALRCGARLPAPFGQGGAKVEMAGVGLANRDREITLEGRRGHDGTFDGKMDIKSILCPGRYRFLVAFRDGQGRRIQLSYRFTMLRATVNRKALPPCR